MTEFIVSLEQLQKLADKLEPEPKETYKVKITLPKIVRCKDCESYQPGMYVHFTCEYLHQWAKPDDFCCWGERKQ